MGVRGDIEIGGTRPGERFCDWHRCGMLLTERVKGAMNVWWMTFNN
jgi:hypothetical protein